MTRAEIYTRVVGILVKSFELDPADIKPESKLFEELDLDSIDAIDLVARLQQLTGQRLGEDAMRKVRSVGDIADLVAEQLP